MYDNNLIEKTKRMLEERGAIACEIAIKEVLNERIEHGPLYDASRHFLSELRRNVHHPALISLAFDAVEGNKDKRETVKTIGAALVLLTGAAHLHDDIIDSTKVKESAFTTFGKFGRDITIILGDVLLFKGVNMLYDVSKTLPNKQKRSIINLVKNAFLEVSNAQAQEVSLRGRWDIKPKACLRLIEKKAAVTELDTRIGAILGEGTKREIEALGKYGRNFGFLLGIREEFLNVFYIDEFKNRVENECLPLPVLYAMRNPEAKEKIKQILRKNELNEEDVAKIIEYFKSESGELNMKVQYLLESGIEAVSIIKNKGIMNSLIALLKAVTTDMY